MLSLADGWVESLSSVSPFLLSAFRLPDDYGDTNEMEDYLLVLVLELDLLSSRNHTKLYSLNLSSSIAGRQEMILVRKLNIAKVIVIVMLVIWDKMTVRP